MAKPLGSNLVHVKNHNQALVLRLICTNPLMSRSQLADCSGLTKMTLSNIVSELIEKGIITETVSRSGNATVGRRPILLDLAESSPCICGMLIKRGLLQVVLGDLRGRILDSVAIRYEAFRDSDELIRMLLDAYRKLKDRSKRTVAAISVAALGPVDVSHGSLVKTPNFYGLSNVEVTKLLEKSTGLPTYIINDANAGALAEKLYGRGKNLSNFVYLHFMNGIGAGAVLNDMLYEGDIGQSLEFGHTSINFAGPKCSCGNTGCVELYANLKRMNEQAAALARLYPDSLLPKNAVHTWNDYVSCADRSDALAMVVLDRFCEYVSYALTNLLNVLDVNHVIVGYDGGTSSSFIEKAISSRINRMVMFADYRSIEVRHSAFDGNGPLVGSIAAVTNRIFNRSICRGEGDEKLLQLFFPDFHL